jgi:hypothetical protein
MKTKIEIQPLCDSAFADLKSKVSQDNVVNEVFSWVTAMCELFFIRSWIATNPFVQPG